VVLITAALVFEGFPTDATAQGWSLMAYLGVVSTFVPFVLFFWMLQRVSATQVSLAGYIVPVIALIGGVILLNEVITLAIAGGGLLVLVGVVITERAEGRHRGAAAGVR
jgi:drug/metabolite transporter (DMT)-like permease